jgi:hypothetical protein
MLGGRVSLAHTDSFPASYTTPIIQFAKDFQADKGPDHGRVSVTKLYANANGTHISGNVTLGGAAFDTTPCIAVARKRSAPKHKRHRRPQSNTNGRAPQA